MAYLPLNWRNTTWWIFQSALFFTTNSKFIRIYFHHNSIQSNRHWIVIGEAGCLDWYFYQSLVHNCRFSKKDSKVVSKTMKSLSWDKDYMWATCNVTLYSSNAYSKPLVTISTKVVINSNYSEVYIWSGIQFPLSHKLFFFLFF